MWGALALKLARFILKNRDLSLQERNLFTSLVLDRLDALPLRDIISTSDVGEILINGSPLDLDKALVLRESARLALENKALNLIREQVMWTAITGGLHNGDTPEKLHFFRSAIWFGQQLEKHLKILAQQEQELTL